MLSLGSSRTPRRAKISFSREDIRRSAFHEADSKQSAQRPYSVVQILLHCSVPIGSDGNAFGAYSRPQGLHACA